MMIRLLACFILFASMGDVMAQSVKEYSPEIGEIIERSDAGERDYLVLEEKCNALWDRLEQGVTEEELKSEDAALYDTCQADRVGYWSADALGCSWYCGGGPFEVTASSALVNQGEYDYKGYNAHDLNYETAWVEGVEGYGIGEYLTYTFAPASPRITKVIIVNGYVRNEETWRANSRVKKLEVLLDGKPMAILLLEDSKAEQTFDIGQIGKSERDDLAKLEAMEPWVLTFKILEVYPGEKYDDTVITEIYFDGIDVH